MSEVVGEVAGGPPPTAERLAPAVGAGWYVWVVAGVALGTALLMWAVGTPSDATADPYYFGEMGRSIANGHGFEGFGSLIQRRAPLYPILLGGMYLVFGENDRTALLIHCVLFVGIALLAFDLGRRYFNPRTGLIAGLLCAFHPLLLRYVPSLHLETLLTFLITLMVWCTLRFYFQRTVLNGALVGATAALAALDEGRRDGLPAGLHRRHPPRRPRRPPTR